MPRRIGSGFLQLLARAVVAGCSLLPGCASGVSPGLASDFELPATTGERVRLSDQLGSVVLLEFFASWSGPSRRVLLRLSDLHTRYASRGLDILAISLDGPQTAAAVTSFASDNRLPFRVLLDQETQATARYNPRAAVPFLVLLGRDGAVLWTREGYMPGDETEIEAAIMRALARAAEPAGR